MAAIAAGNYTPEEGFCGAAPEAMLIIVKVKQAKKYLREFYLFPSQAELFQENDIMTTTVLAAPASSKAWVCITPGRTVTSGDGTGGR